MHITIILFLFCEFNQERQGKNPAYNTSRKWFDLCYDIKGDEIRLLDRAIDREYYQLHYIYSKFYPLHVDDDLQSKNFLRFEHRNEQFILKEKHRALKAEIFKSYATLVERGINIIKDRYEKAKIREVQETLMKQGF